MAIEKDCGSLAAVRLSGIGFGETLVIALQANAAGFAEAPCRADVVQRACTRSARPD